MRMFPVGGALGAVFACVMTVVMPSTSAHALSCPTDADFATASITAQYTLSGASSCAYGTGTYNHSAADAPVITGTVGSWPLGTNLPSDFLEKINQDGTTAGDPTIFTLGFGTPSSDGTITFLKNLTSAFVALVSGASKDPRWAVFEVGDVSIGTILNWSLLQNNPTGAVVPLDLSHAMVFGEVVPDCTNCAGGPAVPIPGAAVLFISGLAGIGLLGRRRRKAW